MFFLGGSFGLCALYVCVVIRSTVSVFTVLSLVRCDSIDKLKSQLPKMEQELKDHGKFKDFYQFTFNFAKNPGQKGLGEYLVLALQWLKCLLYADYFPLLYLPRFRHGNCILEFNIIWEIQIPGFVEHIFTCKFDHFFLTRFLENWDVVTSH